MTLVSRLLARAAKLPKPASTDIRLESDLAAKMPDGVVLLADRYYPAEDPSAPIVLMRTPYGRAGISRVFGHVLAEQGYQVIAQSTRGTFGSGGEFEPFVHEAEDGQATLAWLAEQPWFVPQVAMWGPSYVGYTQWSAAVDPPPYLKAVSLQVTSSTLRGVWYPNDVFALDTALSWAFGVHYQETPRSFLRTFGQDKKLAGPLKTLPLDESDRAAVGEHIDFFQQYLAHPAAGDQIWQDIDRQAATATMPPAVLIAGWYDIFIVDQLLDFKRLTAAGRSPRLIIGPWKHASPGGFTVGLNESIKLYDRELRGNRAATSDAPVRVFLMGAQRWVDLASWPPPAAPARYYLRPGGGLGSATPGEQHGDGTSYTYDPNDPTPTVGGNVLPGHAGPRDNREVESRADVLTFTTPVLEADLTVMGTITADLHVRSDVAHTDFHVRVCDVCPKGQSVNICDGMLRLDDPELANTRAITIELAPTAHVFLRGHHLRLQVSSGAHPHWARNLGTDEPIGRATRTVVAHQTVYHDADRPSAITLPIWTGA